MRARALANRGKILRSFRVIACTGASRLLSLQQPHKGGISKIFDNAQVISELRIEATLAMIPAKNAIIDF
jgi:hypothetical protein